MKEEHAWKNILVWKVREVRMKGIAIRGKAYGELRGVSTLVKPKGVQGKLRGVSSQPIVPDLTIGFSVLWSTVFFDLYCCC